MSIIRVLWYQNLDLRIWYFEKEVLLLFSQKMRPCGLLLSQYGMIDHTLLKGCCEHSQKITSLNCWLRWTWHIEYTIKDLINSAPIHQEEVWREITMSIFPDIVYKYSFTFKGRYDIDMNNLHWYKFYSIDKFKVNFVICVCISDLN